MSQTMTFTEAAIELIRKFMHKRQQENIMVRAYIEGGGCGGLKSHLKVVDEQRNDDTVIQLDNAIKVVVDPISVQYFLGSQVDATGEGDAARFVVTGLQMQGGCTGCGGH